jgi:hypothetical protein
LIQIILGLTLLRELKFDQIKGHVLFKGGGVMAKKRLGSFRILLLRTTGPKKLKFTRHNAKASLLKSWPPGVRWDHSKGNCFSCVYIGKILFTIFLSKTT